MPHRLEIALKEDLFDAEGDKLESYDDDLDIQDDSAKARYQNYYQQVKLTNIIYGLMRSSAVKKTRLMGDGRLPAGDISFMAAMILHGKFVAVPDKLFYRRMHEGAFSANPDPAAQLEFWTASGEKIALPHFKSMWNDVTAIMTSPIPMLQKLSLTLYSAKRMYWHPDGLTKDLKDVLSRS